MDLLEESGLITRVGRVSMDRDCPEHLREPGPEAALEETRRWLEAVRDVTAGPVPFSPPSFVPTCSAPPEGLGRLPGRQACGAEPFVRKIKKEIAVVQERFPEASCYAQVYDRFGLLDTIYYGPPRPLGRQELTLLKERGVFISPTVQNNSNLASAWLRSAASFWETGLGSGLASDVSMRQQPESFPGHGPPFRPASFAGSSWTKASRLYLRPGLLMATWAAAASALWEPSPQGCSLTPWSWTTAAIPLSCP